jgi:UDP-N-acetylmuramoyl-L-alanyl-D-glutamate--2,6-diaminopimelate ligase
MKLLNDILYKAGITEIAGDPQAPVSGIQFDSRKVSSGDLFAAIRGTQTDGHAFIPSALAAGAKVVVCEEIPSDKPEGVTFVKVKDSSQALGVMASNFYGNPSEELKLVGITGTNGKTTTATLLYELFTSLGYSAGLLSTIHNILLGEVIPSSHTTPDPLEMNRLLRDLANRGGGYCFMEVSSHAVAQNRIAGLSFTGGIFSNITHDHLDYHKTFQEYLRAKKGFFDQLPPGAFALINTDDKNGRVMVQNTRARISTYALKSAADFKCRILENQFEGLHLWMDGHDIFCRLTGEFNAYNLTATYAAAILLEQDPEEVLAFLSSVKPVEGRFDTLRSKDNITAIVDYAHTPDALLNVLKTIGELRTRNEKVITVVGAGGDRDRSKRPLMAGICADKSDLVILTSDNPRSEDPGDIIAEMRKGVPADQARKVMVIENRREAIRTACNLASPGDIILVAGKGHEKYQEIKGVRHPFDDKKILEEMLFNVEPIKPY